MATGVQPFSAADARSVTTQLTQPLGHTAEPPMVASLTALRTASRPVLASTLCTLRRPRFKSFRSVTAPTGFPPLPSKFGKTVPYIQEFGVAMVNMLLKVNGIVLLPAS